MTDKQYQKHYIKRENMTDNSRTDDLFIPPVEQDDVEQESRIFEWETGKKASKRIIRQKLEGERGTATVFFGDYTQSGLDDAKDPWENSKVPPEVIEYIVEFALTQSEYLQGLIFEFLDTQNHSLLATISEALDFLGTVEREPVQQKPKRVSISDILRKNLPLSIDEMIALVAQVSPGTKRPAATARQAVRDAEKRGTLVIDDKGFIHGL